MRRVDLIIYDCDGVLVDSELISCSCAAEALRALGMRIDTQGVIDRFLGTARHEMAAQVAALGFAVPSGFAEDLGHAVTEAFTARLQAIEGVERAITSVDALRCVASSSPISYVRRALELTGLDGYFGDNIFSASMVLQGKPAPDLFLHAASEMGALPEKCVVIEDALVGIAAAKAAGMITIGFLGASHINRSKSQDAFIKTGCDWVISEMRELPPLLAALNDCSKDLSHRVHHA